MEGIESRVEELMPPVATPFQDPRFDVLRAEVNRSLEAMMDAAREDRIKTLEMFTHIQGALLDVGKQLVRLEHRRTRKRKAKP